MKNTWLFTAFFILALSLGCGKKKTNIDDEGCEHLKQGPAVALTATAAPAGAPAVNSDHKRYDVTLVSITGGNGGNVTYAASKATDFIFFLGANVPIKFFDSSNVEVSPSQSATSSTACAEIKGRYVVPLRVGTYRLSLGPTTQTSVSIVVEEAED